MFIAKPHEKGEPVALSASGVQLEIQYLAKEDGAKLIPAVDFGKGGNPDGAAGVKGTVGDFTSVPKNSSR